MKYILEDNPNLHLKKFLGEEGVALTKISVHKAGKIRLKNKVELLALGFYENEIVEPGEKVKVIGIRGRKLLVVSRENVKGELKDKIKELEKKLVLQELLDKLDEYIYTGEDSDLEEILEQLELEISGRDTLIEKLTEMAKSLEEEGEIKKALAIYKRIEKLKMWE